MYYAQILQCKHGPDNKRCLMCKIGQRAYEEDRRKEKEEKEAIEKKRVNDLTRSRRSFIFTSVVSLWPEAWESKAGGDTLVPLVLINVPAGPAPAALGWLARQLAAGAPSAEEAGRRLRRLLRAQRAALDRRADLAARGPRAAVTLQAAVRGLAARRRAFLAHLELMEAYGDSYWDYPPQMKMMEGVRPLSPSTLERKIGNFHRQRKRRLDKWLSIKEVEEKQLKDRLKEETRLATISELRDALKAAFQHLDTVGDPTSAARARDEAAVGWWWPGAEDGGGGGGAGQHWAARAALRAVLGRGRSPEGASGGFRWRGDRWTPGALGRFLATLDRLARVATAEEALARLALTFGRPALASLPALVMDPGGAWAGRPLPAAALPARAALRRAYRHLGPAHRFRAFFYRGLLVGLCPVEPLLAAHPAHQEEEGEEEPQAPAAAAAGAGGGAGHWEDRRELLGAFMAFYAPRAPRLAALGRDPLAGLAGDQSGGGEGEEEEEEEGGSGGGGGDPLPAAAAGAGGELLGAQLAEARRRFWALGTGGAPGDVRSPELAEAARAAAAAAAGRGDGGGGGGGGGQEGGPPDAFALDVAIDLSRRRVRRQAETNRALKERRRLGRGRSASPEPGGGSPRRRTVIGGEDAAHRVFVERARAFRLPPRPPAAAATAAGKNPPAGGEDGGKGGAESRRGSAGGEGKGQGGLPLPDPSLFSYAEDHYLLSAGGTGEDMQVKFDVNPSGKGRVADDWSIPEPDEGVAVYTTRMPEGHFFEFRLRVSELPEHEFQKRIPLGLNSLLEEVRKEMNEEEGSFQSSKDQQQTAGGSSSGQQQPAAEGGLKGGASRGRKPPPTPPKKKK